MKAAHFWFRSGAYTLLGHLDAPRGAPDVGMGVGVVVVPPFGWEDACSYRPLRFMARSLADRGIPTLRYDLPGTGDSSGDACDSGLFEAWVRSVSDAAAELRMRAGLDHVAVAGVHLGAMLALMASGLDTSLRDLVLWGAAASGRTILRELRAVANVERWECLSAGDAPPQPIPGFEAGGFLLSPETVGVLEKLDLCACAQPQCRRILLLSRDDLPHDPKLTSALRSSGVAMELAAGHGYSAMMAMPHEVTPPEETGQRIADFLARDFRAIFRPGKLSATAFESGPYTESVFEIKTSSSAMFGILAEPAPGAPRSDTCVLFLNAGGVRHMGPNRMWVESARRWAERGVVSLRLDLPGIGESEGERNLDIPNLYQGCLVDQLEIAMDSVRARTGMRRFAAIGLCSGAFWGFHAALRRSDIRAAILLNPRLFFWDPGADQRRIWVRAARGLTRWADWSRLFRGGVEGRDVLRMVRMLLARPRASRPQAESDPVIGPEALARAWSILERSRQRVTVVFREGEPLLDEMESSGQLPAESRGYVQCIRVPNGGHTFRPLWAQKLVHEVIDNELAAAIPDASLGDKAGVAQGALK